jgi:hypothetical protein
MQNRIIHYCHIKNNQINLNGAVVFKAESPSFLDFLKLGYAHFNLAYPKFFKMDNLSKLAFLNSELVLKNADFKENYLPEEIAVYMSNSSSSLDTDRKHNESIKDRENYFPSPSVFVYTLPNILIGELCIRNNFKGENSFFVFEKFEASFLPDYVNSILNDSLAKACLMGWVDYENEQGDAFFCWIEKSSDPNLLELTSENYKHLYFKTID